MFCRDNVDWKRVDICNDHFILKTMWKTISTAKGFNKWKNRNRFENWNRFPRAPGRNLLLLWKAQKCVHVLLFFHEPMQFRKSGRALAQRETACVDFLFSVENLRHFQTCDAILFFKHDCGHSTAVVIIRKQDDKQRQMRLVWKNIKSTSCVWMGDQCTVSWWI